jgi:hypothetical protein
MIRMQPYVGLKDGSRTLLWCFDAPTQAESGGRFSAVIGPFRTVRGARFCRDYGAGNPHCQCVADAERLAKSLKRLLG